MDSIKLEIYRSLYTSVAEEMGVSLRRTAFSPNIKERRDYSCAVFDQRGLAGRRQAAEVIGTYECAPARVPAIGGGVPA